MVVFPNAKINLGLNVVEKRADGFHNIETVFYPIPLEDVLDIVPNSLPNNRFTSSGINIPSDNKGNLVERAHLLLQKDFTIPFVDIHLYKIIPIGAGLGGGSADAAFAIKALNELFALDLSKEKMELYAAELGSDCPFFIQNKPVYATGKGHDFSSINFTLKGKFMLLIYPPIHVSTADAYAHVIAKPSQQSIPNILQLPISEWKNLLLNDFENSVFAKYPDIQQWKNLLYEQGAEYACMSGSGSSVFGIFSEKPSVTLPDNVAFWNLKL